MVSYLLAISLDLDSVSTVTIPSLNSCSLREEDRVLVALAVECLFSVSASILPAFLFPATLVDRHGLMVLYVDQQNRTLVEANLIFYVD